MTHPICLGDKTTGGGVVTRCQFASFYKINGIPVAVVGDEATCPRHLGTYPFIEGDPRRKVKGIPIVMEGHRLACGCYALASGAVTVSVK